MNNAVKLQSTDDLLGLYDRYVRKFSSEFPTVVVDTIGTVRASHGFSLIVVDMQNDFVLPGAAGRFSVTSGLSVVDPLCKFIERNLAKFKKVIFTRDAHPSNHCSFTKMKMTKGELVNVGGNYPPHCVINHIGAGIYREFEQFKVMPNVDVVFKGMYADADSYGGIDYPIDTYRNKRQADSGPTCCQGLLCMDGDNDKTGARYLVDKSKGFDDFPFTGIDEYREDDLTKDGVCPNSTFENIKDQLHSKPFEIKDLLGDQVEGTHTVFVVGLAGDYCVKDTAINLAKKINANGGKLNGVNTNVVVIEPFTRYPTLPVAFMPWKPHSTYKSRPKNGELPKNINAYLLKSNEHGKMRRLHESEFLSANLDAEGYVHHAFINGIRPLLKDYEASGVTLLMNIPDLSAMAGGARRRINSKTHRQLKSKRLSRKMMGYRRKSSRGVSR